MRRLLLFAPLLLILVAVANADSMAPGIQLRANSTYQGYVTWSDTIYFAAFTGVGTGDIIDFSQVYLGAGGDVWPRMGICSDDTATNVTITGLTDYTLSYMWTGAGGPVRIWCPDMGRPDTVTGGTLTNWDATYQVATVTPTDENVALTWTGATVPTDTIHINTIESIRLLGVLVPLIITATALLMFLTGNSKMGIILIIGAVLATVLIPIAFTIVEDYYVLGV